MDDTAPDSPDNDDPHFRPVPDIAEALGVIVTRIHQLLRDRALIGVRRDGVMTIPADFVADGEIVRGLAGTITLLTDAGYGDSEIIDWLFTPESGLSAMAELRSGHIKSVRRRAQVAGF
ncbi:MAG: Rv2175c family DNA-binding protein [Nakamurella sp.]